MDLLLSRELHEGLLVAGITLLLFALFFSTKLLNYSKKTRFAKYWQAAMGFMVLFLVGYTWALDFVIRSPPCDFGLIVSTVFFVGALFVAFMTFVVKDMFDELNESLSSITALRGKQKELAGLVVALAKKR